MLIREARDSDLPEILEITNALIPTTSIEWTESLHTLEDRQGWLEEHRAGGDPVLVADGGGGLAGFATFSDFRDSKKWPGYRFTVEHTVHVRAERWGSGVGRNLMHALAERAAAAGKHVMVGAIDAENVASIRFHARLGFREVGRMPGIGFKLGRWLTLVLMQRRLGELGFDEP
jgi:L-amino acid N-acyltransferase